MVLTVSFALFPVIGLCCHRHQRNAQATLLTQCAGIVADLTPASRRQNHTTSPSAQATFVLSAISVHRIPLHVRDDRETPLVKERDGSPCKFDLGKKRSGLSFTRWLDEANHVDLAREISFTARGDGASSTAWIAVPSSDVGNRRTKLKVACGNKTSACDPNETLAGVSRPEPSFHYLESVPKRLANALQPRVGFGTGLTSGRAKFVENLLLLLAMIVV
ncbi:MAG TPA: hypothetical protein VHB49_23670, partial [Bradyrhizobium sp.]|nr:hypothetical protein [Bradyrhizobium sp.]